MSPTPGRSTLITSAPNQARSWVQVGPDCTCVKSRTRTPSSDLPASPKGLLVGRGRAVPLPLVLRAAGRFDFTELSFTTDFRAAAFLVAPFLIAPFLAAALTALRFTAAALPFEA